jgi:SAM-dependent methyltransferase
MFDDVANRSRLTFARKAKLGLGLIRESGPFYFILLMIYYPSAWLATKALDRIAALRRDRGVPGINSARLNREIWENWDWNARGDEWTLSPEWKSSIVRSILRPNVPPGCDVLEIGPGAGRWTEFLVADARSYVGIDISAECVRICEDRFRDVPGARFVRNSGADLAALPDRSIDRVWSFDAFVHINRAEVAAYVKELRRVMRPGAVAAIHHGDHGGRGGGWRSDLTAAAFERLIDDNGLVVDSRLAQWIDPATGERHALNYEDRITVFRMP